MTPAHRRRISDHLAWHTIVNTAVGLGYVFCQPTAIAGWLHGIAALACWSAAMLFCDVEDEE